MCNFQKGQTFQGSDCAVVDCGVDGNKEAACTGPTTTTTTTTTTTCILCRDNKDIRTAVAEWVANPTLGLKKYGPITNWDTSKVTDMSWLFCVRLSGMSANPEYDSCVLPAASSFNEDIGKWTTGAVTTMRGMFNYAEAFNKDISKWNTAAVTSMRGMFDSAYVFNQDIGKWDVAAVTDMNSMMFSAKAFNQNIGDWDVSAVQDMGYFAFDARAFSQNLATWCDADGVITPKTFEHTKCAPSKCGTDGNKEAACKK